MQKTTFEIVVTMAKIAMSSPRNIQIYGKTPNKILGN